jgi:hypothetical protein
MQADMGLHDGICRIIAERQEAGAQSRSADERVDDTKMRRFAPIKAELARLVAQHDPRFVKSRLFDDKALLWLGHDRPQISWAVRQKKQLDLDSDDAQIVVNEIDHTGATDTRHALSFSHERTLTTYLQGRIESMLARQAASMRTR